MTQTQQSILLLWSPWELQLRFKARLNQYERQITELVKKGTNIELNTEKNTTTTTKTKTDKGPQEPNNWSKSSQPMHISLQSHEHILYQFSDLHSQFFLCSSVTELFVNKSFFYLKIHCLRKNAAQNIPSGIETKRKLVLVTDKLMPQWLFTRKLKNICCGSSFIGSTMVQLPEEGKITIFRLHQDGTLGWRRYNPCAETSIGTYIQLWYI